MFRDVSLYKNARDAKILEEKKYGWRREGKNMLHIYCSSCLTTRKAKSRQPRRSYRSTIVCNEANDTGSVKSLSAEIKESWAMRIAARRPRM